MTKQDEVIEPIFDVSDRGCRVRAFYVPETLVSPELAHLSFNFRGTPQLSFCWAYRVWNVAAHFRDIVDDYLAEEGLTP